MVAEFARRKTHVMALMKEIRGFEFAEPDGAFYAFPCVDYYFGMSDGSNVIKNADDLSMYLLHTAHVTTVTGSAFGDEKCLRLSFANNMQNIEKGFSRIKEALSKLK
jgi:aspartate aminotransferase